MIRIDDPADPRLDDIRDLNRSDTRPDLPGGKGLVIGEGELVVERLLASRFPVRLIAGFKLGKFAQRTDVPVYEVAPEVLADVVGFRMHRGLVAAADRAPDPTVSEVIANARTLCVTEGVGDHENIGALFRNAAALGVDGVLLGNGTADPLYRRVVRVSMGHVLRVPFARLEGTHTTWQRSLRQLSDAGFRLISLTPDERAVDLAAALTAPEGTDGQPDKVAFLIGAEGPGLTEHAMRATDIRARIPMSPGTDSLNVATAAAVAFYERVRALHHTA